MGITPFGWFHTAISIVAVIAGIVSFARDKEISTKTSVGKLYVVMTILSCLTGFFIFHHGGIARATFWGLSHWALSRYCVADKQSKGDLEAKTSF